MEESEKPQPTSLLAQVLDKTHLTVTEVKELMERKAQVIGKSKYLVSSTQLRRWMIGNQNKGTKGDGRAPKPQARHREVLEATFRFSVEELLGPPRDIDPGYRVDIDIHIPRTLTRTESLIKSFSTITKGRVTFKQLYAKVSHAVDDLSKTPSANAERRSARAAVTREDITKALKFHYGNDKPFYEPTVNGPALSTCILTEPQRLGLDILLATDQERTQLIEPSPLSSPNISDEVIEAAVQVLALVESGEYRLVDNPLYHLVTIELQPDRLSATFGISTFLTYALTIDLMEAEMIDTIVSPSWHKNLPIRDQFMPTVESALALERRLCPGGIQCLFAVARKDDYLLYIQERSPRVLNSTGSLALVPKGYHQPLTEVVDTTLSSTILREIDEELFGRKEFDQISKKSRRVGNPGHPTLMSPALRSLIEHRDSFFLRCCAFGVNLLSGTYEFACIAAIDDPSWEEQFGGTVQMNWEISRLHRVSSRDVQGLSQYLANPTWTNEDLFCFVESLRWLQNHAPKKVELPEIRVL